MLLCVAMVCITVFALARSDVKSIALMVIVMMSPDEVIVVSDRASFRSSVESICASVGVEGMWMVAEKLIVRLLW